MEQDDGQSAGFSRTDQAAQDDGRTIMKEVDWLKSLERDADTGDIDVANAVMRDIRRSAAREESLALPALFATFAGALSIVIALWLVPSQKACTLTIVL